MNEQAIAPNESMQLHEIITLKNTCLTKLITTAPLISDEELKTILQEEIQVSQRHIEELRDLMRKSNLASSDL
jgi:similar to spore coat protein